MGKMFETLRQEKNFKMVLFGSSENIVMSTDSIVCERCLKWNHLSCTSLKKLLNVDTSKLILEIGIASRAE